MPFQVNCSELIADFGLHDIERIRRVISNLVMNYGVTLYFDFEVGYHENDSLYFGVGKSFTIEIEGIPLKVDIIKSRYATEDWRITTLNPLDIVKLAATLETKEAINYGELEVIATSSIAEEVRRQLLALRPDSAEIRTFWKDVEKYGVEEFVRLGIKLIDDKNHVTTLEYGCNGYDEKLGWRFDSGCNHCDRQNYYFFEWAKERFRAEVKSYDGGSELYYDEFLEEKDRYRLIPKREFTLSVNPSAECNEEPRCDYCYLQGKNDIPFEQFFSRFKELCAQHIPTTITFGYNKGYPAAHMSRLLEYASTICDVAVTARPGEVETVLSAGRGDFIDYLALSYDNSMRDFSSLEEMRKLTAGRIKIGVNFLMIKPLNAGRLKKLFKKYGDCFEQFHFLVPKNVPVKLKLEKELDKIGLLKLLYPNKVFIDECLKMVQSGESCRRGKELITLQPDGTTRLCSFAGEDDSEEELKECPYLQNE